MFSFNLYSRQCSCNLLVNCSSFCLLYSMSVHTSAILLNSSCTNTLYLFFHNFYLQPFAECRVNSYKHSAYFSSESSQVWFILVSWQTYVVHAIAFGFAAKCLETEVHNAKFHPKAQVLSKFEKVWVAWNVCVVGMWCYRKNAMVWRQLSFSQGSRIVHKFLE